MKTAPHSIDSERAILGGLLLDPEKIPTVLGIIGREDLYREAHRTIFAAMN